MEDLIVFVDLFQAVNGDVTKEGKEEEDTTFDGEFIKVEKEAFDAKDDAEKAENIPVQDQTQVSVQRSSGGSDRELHESQEKAKELEVELEKGSRGTETV